MSKNNKELEKSLCKIRKIQNQSLLSFKSSLETLIESASRTLKKIDSEGTNGYYSINSDCLKYAEIAWRNSLRLAELKQLEKNIEESFRKKSKEKTKNELDKNK